jgi:hypothetical protein
MHTAADADRRLSGVTLIPGGSFGHQHNPTLQGVPRGLSGSRRHVPTGAATSARPQNQTNSRKTISVESLRRGPSFKMRV